jgi:hypothetical protein
MTCFINHSDFASSYEYIYIKLSRKINTGYWESRWKWTLYKKFIGMPNKIDDRFIKNNKVHDFLKRYETVAKSR